MCPEFSEFGIESTRYIHNFIEMPPDHPQSQNRAGHYHEFSDMDFAFELVKGVALSLI